MGSIISKFFKSILLSSAILAVVGLLLVFQSEFTILAIAYVIGGILIALGTLTLIKYIKDIDNPLRNELNIVYGIVTAILGVIVIKNPEALAGLIPLVVGVIIVINSAAKLEYSLELKKDDNNLWKTTMILSIVTAICGILLIFNPFKGAVFITKIVGALIFTYALLDIISTLMFENTVKSLKKEIKEIVEDVKEAEVIEEKKEKKKKKEKEKK
ncbi:MAG: DUF308 domain-containing protein [Clostridia bacterium]|nr:DUF308 domain-containing protein [Clostridia bacterium]